MSYLIHEIKQKISRRELEFSYFLQVQANCPFKPQINALHMFEKEVLTLKSYSH